MSDPSIPEDNTGEHARPQQTDSEHVADAQTTPYPGLEAAQADSFPPQQPSAPVEPASPVAEPPTEAPASHAQAQAPQQTSPDEPQTAIYDPAQAVYPPQDASHTQPYPPADPGFTQPVYPQPQQSSVYPQPQPLTGYQGQSGGAIGAPPPAPRRNLSPVVLIGVVAVVAIALVAGLIGATRPGGVFNHPAATATATVRPTATPVQQVVYNNALTATADGWPNDNECAFKADGYHLTANVICFAPPDAQGDATISTSVKQVAGPLESKFGLVLRRPSKGNYYQFQIDGAGQWEFDKVVANTASVLVQPTVNGAIKKGLNASNVLEVRMRGAHFDLYANGAKVGQADDTTFATGIVGVSGTVGADVVYTNFKVTKPAA